MPYQTIDLDLAGPSDQNQSSQSNSELTKNWRPEPTNNGRSDTTMLPWLGSTLLTANTGTDRGTHVFQEVLYHVIDTTLYSVADGGVYTSVGTIAGTERCVFADNGVEMVIASLGNVYSYNGATLTKGGADFNNTTSVTMLNNQFIYDDSGDQWFVSNAGDALTINGLNFAQAESAGDDLERPYAYNQWVYFFGKKTVEPWWNSAEGNPPFDRLDSGIIQKGLGGRYTLAQTDQFLYFLGDDGIVYQIVQSQVRQISTASVAYQMAGLDWSSATAYTMNKDGQDYYIISFGALNLTYAYSEQLGEWFNLSTGVSDERYLSASYQFVYNKHYAIDYRNASLVELSDSVYTDLGETIQRVRVLPPVNSFKLGLGAGKRLLMSKAKVILQTGVGLASGQGSDPQIMVQYSDDGGQVWSTERWLDVGRMGQFDVKSEFWEMKSFYDIQFKITVSDPVFSSLQNMSLDVKAAGY